MSRPQFWIIAGPNGAGKSTFAKSSALANEIMPKPLNPDDFALALLRRLGYAGFGDAPADAQRQCSLRAAEWAYAQVDSLLRNGGIVAVETVLSTEKYLPLFRYVAQSGGDANLIYVGNQSPEVSIARVAIRVRKGGHGVPINKIRARWHRSLHLLPVFWQLARRGWLFDNSNSTGLPVLVAYKSAANGATTFAAQREGDVLAAALNPAPR